MDAAHFSDRDQRTGKGTQRVRPGIIRTRSAEAFEPSAGFGKVPLFCVGHCQVGPVGRDMILPEPSSLVLLATALLMVAYALLRRAS